MHTNSFPVTFTLGFIVAISLPLLFLGISSYLAKKANGASLIQNFAKFGYAIIAIDVAAHVAHNLFHLLAEGGSVYITGATFFGKELQNVSPALLGGTTIQILQYVLIALGTIGSLYAVYRIAKNNFPTKIWASSLPYWVLILIMGSINIVLFSLPMAHRL